MDLSTISKASSDLMNDIGVLTTQVVDNRTLLVLARSTVLLSLLIDEVKRLDKLTCRQGGIHGTNRYQKA